MTFREKLADLISGGALSRAIGEAADMAANAGDWKRSCIEYETVLCDLARSDTRAALRAIAACETPGANATVKRMAKLAREALQ